MFFEGLFKFILSVITLIVTTSIDKLDNFLNFWKDERLKGKEILILISWLFVNFLYLAFLFKIIDIFSPFHLHLSLIISDFIIFFINFKSYNTNQKIFYFLSILFCSFMIFVFIEIIELNFCGLSKMTKKNIELRAQLDCLLYNNNDDDDEEIDLKDYTLEFSRTTENNRMRSVTTVSG